MRRPRGRRGRLTPLLIRADCRVGACCRSARDAESSLGAPLPSRLPTLFGDGDGDGVASQPVLLGGKQDTRERACRRSQRQSNSRGPQATLHNRRFVTRSAGGVCRSLHGLGGCLVRPALFIMISWPRSRRYLGGESHQQREKAEGSAEATHALRGLDHRASRHPAC